MYVGTPGEKKIWLQKIRGAINALLDTNEGETEELRKASHTYKNGTIYEGYFLNTKRHGHGKMTIPYLMTYDVSHCIELCPSGGNAGFFSDLNS